MIHTLCPQPTKFYIDCSVPRTLSNAVQFCNSHQMSLVNFTNATGTLANDIDVLNNTFISNNCAGYFWFSMGNLTGLAVNVNQLGDLSDGLLTGLLSSLLCGLLLPCPGTTTPAPITNAYTVCTRPIQQKVVQKCSIQSSRSDMKQYQYVPQNIRAGLLDRFSARNALVCNGLCSSDVTCIGTSFNSSTCTLYM